MSGASEPEGTMKDTILVGLLVASIAPVAVAQYYVPGANTRTIASTGSASVNVVPDEIYVGIGIETFNAALDSAIATNTTSTQNVVRAVTALGVAERKITLNAMTVDIKYMHTDHPSEGIEGYFAKKELTIVVDSPALAERVVATSLRNGANRVLGIRFNTTALRKVRDEARQNAAKAAREKAELIATTLGAKVGKPLSISEGYGILYGSSMWTPYYGYYGNQMLNQNVSSNAGGGSESSDMIPAGEMAVQATVSVTFELMP
jgi:uncharacterized protein